MKNAMLVERGCLEITNQVPCQNCGATDYIVTMVTDCDKCNPDLSLNRIDEQMNCPHKNQIPSRIVGFMKCEDCGMVGCNIFKEDAK